MSFDFQLTGRDIIFDEKGNQFLAIRDVSWDGRDSKLELRKWVMPKEEGGNDVPLKGFSFLTANGPSELVCALLKEGYGDTKDVLEIVSERDDYIEVVTFMNEGKEDAVYYDPKSIFGGDEENE